MKLKFKRTEQFCGHGFHRTGWPATMTKLLEAGYHHEDGEIMFDDFIEQSWLYGDATKKVIRVPWAGIFHHPPDAPEWHHHDSLTTLFRDKRFLKSLESMVWCIALSEHLGDYLRSEHGLKVFVLKHPTDLNVPQWTGGLKHWYVQIGWYLRNSRFIHQIEPWELPLTNKKIRKFRCYGDAPWMKHMDEICRAFRWRPEVGKVNELSYVPNETYDKFLSNCVIVNEILASSANNVVIDCIARNTPLIVNRIPAIEEYLGPKYPLYLRNISDIPRMDIQAGHEYLKALNKSDLTFEHFTKTFGETTGAIPRIKSE